jgi:hypothetical protein
MTEAQWMQGDDPRKMMRHLLRHPSLRPTARKAILLGAALARMVWRRTDWDIVRRLVECREKMADEVVRFDQYHAIAHEINAGGDAPEDPAIALTHTFPALSVIEATLRVPDVTPGSVCAVVRELFGNCFRRPGINPLWLQFGDGAVMKLAQGVYAEGAFDRLPVVADALEEAGCDDAALLGHCRSGDRHYRGCWAVDALLGKTDAEPDQTAWNQRRAERARPKSSRARVTGHGGGS